MSLADRLVLVSRDLARLHPEMSTHDRMMLAAEAVDRGWVWLRGDGGSVNYTDELRERAPSIGYSSDPVHDAKLKRGREAAAPAPPPPPVAALPTDDSAASRAVRAHARERAARDTMRAREAPAKRALADLGFAKPTDTDQMKAKRAMAREDHVRAQLGDRLRTPTPEEP